MAQGTIRTRCAKCRKAGLDQKECLNHKERRFEASYRDPSGKQWAKTFLSKKEAEAYLAKSTTQIFQGTYRAPSDTTFNEVADQWLAEQRNHVRPASWSLYESMIRTHLRPALGNFKLKDVSPAIVSEVRQSLTHKSYSLKKKVNQYLRGIFRLALINRLIAEDPTAFGAKIKNLRPPARKAFMPEQAKALLDTAELYQRKADQGEYGGRVNQHEKFVFTSYPGWRRQTISLAYRLAVFAGLRPNESFGLTWDCIDMEKRLIRVEKTLYWFKNKRERGTHSKPWVYQDCKSTAAYREIPIGPDLLKSLQIQKIQASEKSALVLASETGSPMIHNNFVKRYFKTDIHRAGLPEIPFYNLRHTYCSLLVASGERDVKRIQYLMGHEDIRTTLNVYAQFLPTENTGTAERLEALVLGRASAVPAK